MGDWSLRIRAILEKQFTVVVVILVVLLLAGGWLTYATHVEPGTTTEVRPTSSWETAGWFNHSATVAESNSLYPVGTTLTDRSHYFASISPVLNGTYSLTYVASEGGHLNVSVSFLFVLRSVEESRQKETVVWKTSELLGTASNESLEPDETIRVPFSFDLNQTRNRTEAIDDELENSPGRPEVLVNATVELEGTVNGHDVDRTIKQSLPVEMQQGTYRLTDPGVKADRQESTQTVTVQRTYNPLRTVGSPLLLLGSAATLGGLVMARRRESLFPSQRERELLAYHDDRTDYDEWITQATLPDEFHDRPRATTESLEGLVNYAIDTDRGVIEDTSRGVFAVIAADCLYVYEPQSLSADREGSESTSAEGHSDQNPTDAVSSAPTAEQPSTERTDEDTTSEST